jgi:hypothetical protein
MAWATEANDQAGVRECGAVAASDEVIRLQDDTGHVGKAIAVADVAQNAPAISFDYDRAEPSLDAVFDRCDDGCAFSA